MMGLATVELKITAPVVHMPSYFMLDADRAALAQLLRDAAPRRMIEIGVNQGFTAAFILANVPSIEDYVGIDVECGYVLEIPEHTAYVTDHPGNLAAHDPRFSLLIRRRGSLDLTLEDIGPCDAMFIDGDHGPVTVARDTDLADACVRCGGLILWHDATNYAVKGFLEQRTTATLIAGTDLAYEVKQCT